MFSVKVAKDYLSFSAAHFVVEGTTCERLHGHNYGVAVEVEGTLDQTGYVVDFIKIKKIAKAVCDSLDHRLLLPMDNEYLKSTINEGEMSVTLGSKSFVFPLEDVLSLPIPNITAEYLAQYIGDQLEEELESLASLTKLTTTVSEAPGQEAMHLRRLGQALG